MKDNINWKGVDLNLLLSFDAIYRLQSVSKAAESLHLGQPALSYNLNRLRKLLGDPLFERQGHQMVASARAKQLAPTVRQILMLVEQQILPNRFDASASTQAVIIGLSDYAEMVFGPKLYDQLQLDSPAAPLVFRAVDQANVEASLEQGNIDLAIGVFSELSSAMNRQVLYNERHLCLFDQQALGCQLPISLEDYLDTPQAIVTADGRLTTAVDRTLAAQGLKRQVALGSSRFLTLPHLLKGRQLLCVVAELLSHSLPSGHGLSRCVAPIDIANFDVEMVSLKRDGQHPRMQWLLPWVKRQILSQVNHLRNS